MGASPPSHHNIEPVRWIFHHTIPLSSHGQLQVAHNAFVRLTLHDGTVGYGEIAPFPAITGEDRESSLKKARILGRHLLGQSTLYYQRLGHELSELAPDAPAARCGLETALLDALTRAIHVPLWALWGGADVRERETDVTIPSLCGADPGTRPTVV